jgi:dihydrolipoamide dehydrogenase
MNNNYNLIIVGSGPSGVEAALRSAKLGLKVLIVEKDTAGGTCVNMGAVPTKALLKNAEIAWTLGNSGRQFGFSAANLELDYKAAILRSRQVAKTLSEQITSKLQQSGVDFLSGIARVVNKNTVEVITRENYPVQFTTDHIVIATGATPMQVPGIETDGRVVMDYRHAVLEETKPESVLIVGGGALGVEFASFWNAYGVKVTIVEMLSHLVPYEDQEIGMELEKAFITRGIRVITNARIESIQRFTDHAEVYIRGRQDKTTVRVARVLEAVSFKHNSEGLGLEEIGVKLGDNGVIETDEHMQTSIPGIWAIGDVNGKLMLAAAGREMGRYVAEKIAGHNPALLNYENMPKITYCHPQIASFGITAEVAHQRGYRVKTARIPFSCNSMAICQGDTTGWLKLVADADTHLILGTHMIGANVQELLGEIIFATANGHTLEEMERACHGFPTLGEIMSIAAHECMGG